MTEAQVAALRQDASILLYQMPEEVLAPLIGLMKGIAGQAGVGFTPPAVIGARGIPPGQQSGGTHFGKPAVRAEPGFAAGEFVLPDDADTQKPKRIFGVAAGKFVCPDDIDVDNELIADMFEGRR